MSSKLTIFEKSRKGARAFSLPKKEKAFADFTPPNSLLRGEPPPLPEVSELDLTRHFTGLAKKNVGIDSIFYPLGSCTMKLNPRINEKVAALPNFTQLHPMADDSHVQGALKVIFNFMEALCKLCGMKGGSFAPNAGAQGEFCGIKMIAAYHAERGDSSRNEILVPDNAHGTNPATAAICGYQIVSIPSGKDGDLNLDFLKEKVGKNTAGLMLTNPNTLGLFSGKILEISKIIHEAGGLLYYDGANLNAIMNRVRPGDMGFDVMHLNLHKTFSTPHGGGGPGSGPVLCNERLLPFLPLPRVKYDEKKEMYTSQWKAKASIGHIATFYGNFGIYLRAYTYFLLHGMYGLQKVSNAAVLNANYLKSKLSKIFKDPFPGFCMHEFVLQADRFLDKGIKAYDLVKRLLDFGMHAPTVYFPLIVKECLLIEPTECESQETLDTFCEAFEMICSEVGKDPEFIKKAPYTTPVRRLDEGRAAKKPILKAV